MWQCITLHDYLGGIFFHFFEANSNWWKRIAKGNNIPEAKDKKMYIYIHDMRKRMEWNEKKRKKTRINWESWLLTFE